ncbi:MAG TPA: type II toxin-antitoxin system VapC family toxin [Candidatus Angelobacter sp.]
MTWLLDTNVLSELKKPRPEARVVAFISSLPLGQAYISSVTLAEIRFGIDQVSDPAQRADLNHWLTNDIRPMFSQRILQVTEDILLKWRTLVEQGRKVGHTYSQPEILIAATAIQYGLTVVTRDRRDYDKAGVSVINPWNTI